jgi:DNA-directed RNA polymerase subunit RPC12/RpoP
MEGEEGEGASCSAAAAAHQQQPQQKRQQVRVVRCPKCEKFLPELPNYSVYVCGGCGTTLQGLSSFFRPLSFCFAFTLTALHCLLYLSVLIRMVLFFLLFIYIILCCISVHEFFRCLSSGLILITSDSYIVLV